MTQVQYRYELYEAFMDRAAAEVDLEKAKERVRATEKRVTKLLSDPREKCLLNSEWAELYRREAGFKALAKRSLRLLGLLPYGEANDQRRNDR